MPTVNIKTDYSAVGDGQIASTNVTISTNVLTVSTSLFVSGDVGKWIAITGCFTPGGTNPLGTLLTTISGFTSGTVVTLAASTSISLSGSPQQVEWGHDDYGAFQTFKDDFLGQTGVVLNIPAGRYLLLGISAGTSVGFAFGITGFQMVGTGNPVLSDGLGGGNSVHLGGTAGALTGDVAKVQSVNAGANTVTLINSGDAALFSANTWALMSGLDVQGFGFPPNWHFHEWVFITNITGSVITFSASLVNDYKSTWPEWVPGSGGPAALCPATPTWDCAHEYSGITFVFTYTVTNANGRSMTFTNCTFPAFGPNASTVRDFTLTNCSILNNNSGQWELDKCLGNVTMNGGTLHALHIQSGAVSGTFSVSNATVGNFNGTPLNTVLNNVSGITSGVTLGVGAYGSAQSFQATGCDISGGLTFGGRTDPISDTYSMSGGVITRPIDFTLVTNAATAAGNSILHFATNTIPTDTWDGMTLIDLTTPTALDQTPGGRPFITAHDRVAGTITMSEAAIGPGVGSGDTIRITDRTPPYWCVPKQTVFWSRGDITSSFRILDIAESSGHVLITTDQSGGFPTLPGSGTLSIRTHASPSFRLTSCTGPRDVLAMSGFAAAPCESHWRNTYTTNIGTSEPFIPILGEAISITVTINTTFGAGTLRFNSWIVQRSSGVMVTTWLPSIDLSRGPRTVTISPSGVTSTPIGLGGADSSAGSMAFPGDGIVWLMPSQTVIEMAGVSAPGSVTVDFVTNQGVVTAAPTVVSAAPLRLRVHA